MTNTQLIKYMEKKYWKEDQHLNLTTELEKDKPYYQDICVDDYYLCEIQTLDWIYPSEWGCTPYCFKPDWTGFVITVPKFGVLIDADVHKAIAYCLKQLKRYGLWNVYLDGEHIDGHIWNEYTMGYEALHEWKEMLRRKEQ